MFLSKKSTLLRIVSIFIAIIIAFLVTACSESDENDTKKNDDSNKLKITGKVSFANPSSSGAITLYLEKTNGLYADSIQSGTRATRNQDGNSQGNRKKTTANSNGSYTFDNVEEGVYTIYASSQDESEQAILINVPVEKTENNTVDANPMTLKPVGSIKGKIILDGSSDNNLGFTVFIAGTSYTAITDQSGNFEISNVPADTVFQIAVMRGVFAVIWTDAIAESEKSFDLGEYKVTTSQLLGDAMIWKGILSSHPSSPQKNWSYFNSSDRKTYVYTGTEWRVTGQVLTTSNVEYRSTGHTSGSVPLDSNPDGGYVIGATVYVMGQGTLTRDGYRFDGWQREGNSEIYTSGQTFIMGANPVIFNAVWLQIFTISFDGNGNDSGTAPASVQGVTNEQIMIISGTLQKTGHRFIGWSINQNATNSQYSSGGSFSVGNENTTLYAVWARLYTVTFDGNGHTGGTLPQSEQGISGELITIPYNGNITKTGYRFNEWNTQADGNGTKYLFESSFIISSENKTLYAVWAKLYTVTFDGNGHTGGTVPQSEQGISGEHFTIPDTGSLEKSGYYFVGWNTLPDANGIAYLDFRGDVGIFVNENIILYAIWSEFYFDCSYRGTSKNIVIPAIINKVPVTSIKEGAFSNLGLVSVIIPNGIVTIGRGAFGLNNLTSIVIPDSVTTIEGSAFADNRLTSVIITNNSTKIGNHAFSNNRLTSIDIPDSVTSIEYGAFSSNSMTSIDIPRSVTFIGGNAFSGNQLTSIVIPDNVTSIEGGAFMDNQLTSVIISNNVTIIDQAVFAENNISSVVIPESVTNIEGSAFRGSPLVIITISNGVLIDDYETIGMTGVMGRFGTSFIIFYNDNGKKAGTYTYDEDERTWSAVFK